MLLNLDRMGPGRYSLYAIAIAVAAFLVLPIVFIGLLSFGSSQWLVFPPPGWSLRWYREVWADERWIDAFWTSARVACVVTVLSVAIGLPASFALVRGRFPGRTLLHAFFISPMIVPVIVLGIGLYSILLRVGLSGTYTAFVAGHLIMALPFSIICITNSLQIFDRQIEQAAQICGASPSVAIRRVTLPSIRLGIMSAALFSFLASWDEVVLSIFLASPTLQTMSVKIWTALQSDLTPVVSAVSTVLVVLTMLLMGAGAVAKRLANR